jgi:signal peptidase II
MTRPQRLILILTTLILSVGLDQYSKKLAIDYLRGARIQSFFFDTFRLEYTENPGAFLGLGSALSAQQRFWILSVSVGLFLVFLLYQLVWSKAMSTWQTLALTLILGGGVSNLIDRVFRTNGQVVDFMNAGIGSLRTGVFNIADFLILLGIGFFLLDNFAPKKRGAVSEAK